MRKQTKGHKPAVCAVLLLAGIACASSVGMGELVAGESVTFEARDETDYSWEAKVEPGEEYTLSVVSKEYDQASFYGFMYIYDEGVIPTEDGSNLIAEGDHFTPSVSFVAPKDGDVTIVIFMINWVNTEIEITLTRSAD